MDRSFDERASERHPNSEDPITRRKAAETLPEIPSFTEARTCAPAPDLCAMGCRPGRLSKKVLSGVVRMQKSDLDELIHPYLRSQESSCLVRTGVDLYTAKKL